LTTLPSAIFGCVESLKRCASGLLCSGSAAVVGGSFTGVLKGEVLIMDGYLTKAQIFAFERGAAACREGKSREDNPYPQQADYFGLWEEGYRKERESRGK
jgi:ribosome modulation factor